MRKIVLLLSFALVLLFAAPVMAGNVSMSAADFEPTLVRGDLNYVVAVKKTQDSKFDYIVEYQIVYVTVTNNTAKPININPGYFTLASSAKKSYPFTAEMFGLKNKLPWLDVDALDATRVLPGTSAEGFLMFKKKYKNEYPVSLYFESPETSGTIKVERDPKAKYE
ncbi:DUF4352 domain-containing protein [Pseudodesulfovibrio sp. JC047]|uniref:DUF4352 domain-containing protein n=1 Tax=Pseudodesulfovibrio sp. JC047 TaxID=2683199 RepID=UPI0013D7A4EE|nr:DUF4352 domain-containing protein [Pseudodesulfovibrio sp. JC047]NDV20839.1 DUF4352 domain-containing protein [Pseudodesulfovibrio sp. JC047]